MGMPSEVCCLLHLPQNVHTQTEYLNMIDTEYNTKI